jgi:Domain of unknown function (DUF1844)
MPAKAGAPFVIRFFSTTMGEEEKDNIRVEDRRFFDKEGNPVHQEQSTDSKTTPQKETSSPTPPRIDFASFVFIYVQTTLIHLGDLEDPVEKKMSENLEAARQTIDVLDMLKEKTKGNLSRQEEQYFDSVLFDLRMRYVEKAKRKS